MSNVETVQRESERLTAFQTPQMWKWVTVTRNIITGGIKINTYIYFLINKIKKNYKKKAVIADL